jgi:hypothetical protein
LLARPCAPLRAPARPCAPLRKHYKLEITRPEKSLKIHRCTGRFADLRVFLRRVRGPACPQNRRRGHCYATTIWEVKN